MNSSNRIARRSLSGLSVSRCGDRSCCPLNCRSASSVGPSRRLVQGVSNGENFLLKNDTVRAATQSFVRGARISSIVYGEDGICIVTVQVTIQQLVEHLTHALDMVDRNGYNKERNELQTIEAHIERKVIVETGTGAVNTNPSADGPKAGVVVP